jgi:hypothetical protein
MIFMSYILCILTFLLFFYLVVFVSYLIKGIGFRFIYLDFLI